MIVDIERTQDKLCSNGICAFTLRRRSLLVAARDSDDMDARRAAVKRAAHVDVIDDKYLTLNSVV